MAVDANGNVFVTGYSYVAGYSDFVTLAYSGAGALLWQNLFNRGGNDSDVPTALALDGSGNVFVTGSSYIGGSNDYATVAYTGAGVQLWDQLYDGPGNAHDSAAAVAVDRLGNVFVTGSSYSGSSYDYATIKYSSAGTPLWTNRYDGPANYDDAAVDVATDGSGNAVVTGNTFSGSSLDPGGFNYDFATIKYSGSGATLWTNRYDAAANYDDYGTAAAVDSSGNVLVSGDGDTIKYSDAGVPLWTNSNNGGAAGLALDGGDNVVVACANYSTRKYSSAGVLLWTNRYKGPGNSDELSAMAMARNGNVIVTGKSVGSSGNWDYATVAYSSNGIALWTNRFDAGWNNFDEATAVVADGNGNVFVTGHSVGGGTSLDYATIKYSGAGVPLWTNRYNGPANSDDYAYALAVDRSGNVFVTGASDNGGGFTAYATIKYSAAGALLWTRRYNGPSGIDDATAIAVDGSGNVVVTGESRSGSSDDYATIKYSSAGVALWTNRYDGPANGEDLPSAVAVDGSGNVYVTGSSAGSAGGLDFVTLAYSSAGVPLWTNRYNGPVNGDDRPQSRSSIAVAPDGSVYVTGASDANPTFRTTYDYVTIKYSTWRPLLNIKPDRSGGYLLRFQGIPGYAYRLQRAPTATGPWTTSDPLTAPASGMLEFWDLFAPPGQAFYRTVQP
jgi:hypothetical protein